jgi:hypothetical protein
MLVLMMLLKNIFTQIMIVFLKGLSKFWPNGGKGLLRCVWRSLLSFTAMACLGIWAFKNSYRKWPRSIEQNKFHTQCVEVQQGRLLTTILCKLKWAMLYCTAHKFVCHRDMPCQLANPQKI